jgi:hypothetical protein
MTGYQIQDSTLRCARTGRELQPEEKYYSVLFVRDNAFVREDISLDAWQGPPDDAFSFWRARVPPRGQTRRIVVDDEVLLDCLNRLADELDPPRLNFRYVLALLLMRRKRLKFEDVKTEDGQEYLLLRCSRTRTLHRILNPQLTEPQIAGVQDEVQKILGLV